MKMSLRLLVPAGLLAASAVADSPVGKAVQLLSDLQGKIIKEGEAAQKTYGEFSEWCEEQSKELQYEIKTGKAQKAELEAAIAQHAAKIGESEAEIEALSSDLATDEADLKAANAIRTQEKSTFDASEKELVSVTDMMGRAIGIIEKEMKKGGASMVQLKNANSMTQALAVLVQASHLDPAEAEKIGALVQTGDEADSLGAPAASVYESSSGGILQTLADLKDKSDEQLDSVRKQETSDIHAFEMMEQSLKNEIKNGKKEIAEAKEAMAAAAEKKSKAEGDLQMTSKELASDDKSLGDLHHECMTKAEEFEAETKSRAEELKALAAAKAALSDNTGAAEGLMYGLNQIAFMQVRARTKITSRAALAGFEAVHLVRDLAKKHHDSALAQLAARLGASTGEAPFAKIKGLIQDMIEKLEKEAEEDATKKAFCDKELAETNEKKEAKTSEISKLTSQIDKMSATSAQLKEETAALQKALSALAKSQAEMDKIRSEEKEAYAANKVDMEQGLKGVKLALKVLREYYAKEDKAHSAADGAGGGVIGLLEVVESDFTKGLAEMTSDEESAADLYDSQTKENQITRATKEADVKYKVKESTELDKTVAETTSDRSGVQAELDAVMEYLHKIEEQCIAKAETHEARAARFAAEIEGLKQALQVLEEETAPTLLQRRSLRKVLPHVK